MTLSSAIPVAVVGAGAAGMTAAIFAARGGVDVVLLETRPTPGAKIRVSGGGRCNVLPSRVSLANFHTGGSEKAMRNVLFSWPLEEVTAFFRDELDVPLYVEEGTGKVFPQSNDARDIVTALLGECERAGVRLVSDFRLEELTTVPVATEPDPLFLLRSGDRRIQARKVILATGGRSLPRTGSDGHGLELANDLGHTVVPLRPALVPLETDEELWRGLAGISLPVRLRAVHRIDGKILEEREGDFLFTHRGFSGPVVLDLSRHVTGSDPGSIALHACWLGSQAPDWEALLKDCGKTRVATTVRGHIPRRLADVLLDRAEVPLEQTGANFSRDRRARLVEELADCRLPISGNEGYAKAEVTAGGIPLAEVHLRTLESRDVPGLHFSGEILDVVGHIGGYNFLWAWVSGRRAGEGAAAGC